MVKISEGDRFDISSGQNKVHFGTLSYLERIKATPRSGTERDVPEAHIDGEGKYTPPKGEK